MKSSMDNLENLQSEETSEFRLYQTEQEYWEEYDRLHNKKGNCNYGK